MLPAATARHGQQNHGDTGFAGPAVAGGALTQAFQAHCARLTAVSLATGLKVEWRRPWGDRPTAFQASGGFGIDHFLPRRRGQRQP